MANILDILTRAQALRQETALNSITPDRAGGIMYDTLILINQMQLEGGSLLISKVYSSVAAMEADTTPTSDLTGRALRPGQLAVIVPSSSSSSDMGSVYRYNEPGSWTLCGKIGGLPMDTVPTEGSSNGITSGAVYQTKQALEGEVSQLQHEVTDLDGQINGETDEEKIPQTLTIDKWFNTNNNPLSNSPSTLEGTACVKISVIPGEKYRITGLGGNQYSRLYATADANRTQVRYAVFNVDARITPVDITIDEGEAYLFVNLSQYDSQTDKVEKVVTTIVPGLEDRVEILEGKTFPITDNTGTSSELAASQKIVTAIKEETDSAISEINKAIDGETTEEYVPVSLSLFEDRIVNTNNDPLPNGPTSGEYLGYACGVVSVSPGEKYRIYGQGGNKYILLYAITNANRQKVRVAELNVDARTNPVYLEIEQGEAYLYLNFTSYNSLTDKLEKQSEIETPGLEDRVSSLETRVDALEGKDVKVYLPNKLYAVVGDTLQLFFQGIVGVVNISDYDIYAVCSKGKTFPRYFSYTPMLEDVGTTTLTVYVKDRDNNILGQASCDLITVSAPSSPVTAKSIFTFGDSLTAGGQWPGEAKRRLVGNSTYDSITGKGLSNLEFYGYMNKTINGQSVNYFGVGGWTWANYLSKGAGGAFRFNVSGVSSLSIGAVYTNNGYSYTVQEINITGDSGNIRCTTSANTNTPSASGTLTKTSGDGDATITFASYETENANPLWDDANNKMSFIPYVQDCGASTIDAVYVLLSWNGQEAWREYSVDDETGHIANAKVFARTLHTEYPNAKLFIMGLQMPSDTGGLGYNYGASGGLIDGQGVKQTAFNYNKALQDLCNLDEFSQYCEFVAVAPQFDSHYNMPHSNTKVNIRNSDTEMIGTNGVHPSPSGYNQIADAVYRSIVANFCQS